MGLRTKTTTKKKKIREGVLFGGRGVEVKIVILQINGLGVM